MLLGFVVSFIFAVFHKLRLGHAGGLTVVQFYIHQAGSLVLFIGLLPIYGGFAKPESLDAGLATASTIVLTGMLLMGLLFVRVPTRG